MGMRALLLAAALSPVWGGEDTLRLFMLPSDQYNATCTDGTPVGYYLREAPKGSPNKNKVVFWLKGGDFCQSYKDCVRRQNVRGLGSSKNWPKSVEGTAIQSANKTENPDFWDWNVVYLEYCSGDLWSGTQVEPMNPWVGPDSGPMKFTFAGHLYIDQVLDHLVQKMGKVVDGEFILTGGSAGGIGTFKNADFIASRLPAGFTKFRAMPQGGFFGHPSTDFPHFASNTTDPDPWLLGQGSWLANISRYLNPAEQKCVANPPAGLPTTLLCTMPLYFYPFTTQPMFVVQASADYYQVFENSKCPKGEVGNATVNAYIEYQRGLQAGDLKRVVVNGPKTATDGLFAPACLGHTVTQMGWTGTARVPPVTPGFGPLPGANPKVDGQWLAQAFGDWYFGREGVGGTHMHLDDSNDLTKLCACYTRVCYK